MGAAIVLTVAVAVEPRGGEAQPVGVGIEPAVATPTGHAALLDGLIGALPDAAAVVDRSGLLLAANAQALAMAPALRIGEPVLLALRMPAVVDAMRQAAATAQALEP